MANPTPPVTLLSSNDDPPEYKKLLGSFLSHRLSNGRVRVIEAAESAPELQALFDRAAPLREEDIKTWIANALHHEGSNDGPVFDTPLLRAIACRQNSNVELLLRHGAHPNGIDRASQTRYALRFRRVHNVQNLPVQLPEIPVKNAQVGDARSQTSSLTGEDLWRRGNGVARFWTDLNVPPLDLFVNGNLLHALIMAARHGHIEVFDDLLVAGAEANFWKDAEARRTLPSDDDLTPSMLCVSTPLHAAIDAHDVTMISAILDRGFNPNMRALMAGSQAMTALQYAVAAGDRDAYNTLAAHPLADTTLLTPVLGVHALHLAVAGLREDLIASIGLPLASAPPTALSHTLLHVACLPLDSTHVQLFSLKVRDSIHDVRSLDPHWKQGMSASPRIPSLVTFEKTAIPAMDGPGDLRYNAGVHTSLLPLILRRRLSKHSWLNLPLPSTDHHDAQSRIVKMILETLGIVELQKEDVYGNTALHYLAGARIVNDELVVWLRAHEEANRLWQGKRNCWGWTPSDLWLDNVTTIEPEIPRSSGFTGSRVVNPAILV